MHGIAFLQKKLGQIRAVLSGDPGYQCLFHDGYWTRCSIRFEIDNILSFHRRQPFLRRLAASLLALWAVCMPE